MDMGNPMGDPCLRGSDEEKRSTPPFILWPKATRAFHRGDFMVCDGSLGGGLAQRM
jgi:hypothetical protein